MRLLIVTDAWHPQINGVVRTLGELQKGLSLRGWQVLVLGPDGITIPCPTYPEIRLTLNADALIRQVLREWQPETVHIATEGPLGWAMRKICLEKSWPFTTSFHTRFPEYLKSRFFLPRRWTYSVLRLFHERAERVLVPTPAIVRELRNAGFSNTVIWGRGVDTRAFTPARPLKLDLPRPIQLYVGRVAVEKNLPAFLSLPTPGTKVVVGDGPMRAHLQQRFPETKFLGALHGSKLAGIYAAADVFVFPSLTDTFGLVLLEALACGTPVAAYPATGPLDVLTDSRVATLDQNLQRAVERSLTLDRFQCRQFAMRHSWDNCVDTFAQFVAPFAAPEPATLRVASSQLLTIHS